MEVNGEVYRVQMEECILKREKYSGTGNRYRQVNCRSISRHGNTFLVFGPLLWESTDPRSVTISFVVSLTNLLSKDRVRARLFRRNV